MRGRVEKTVKRRTEGKDLSKRRLEKKTRGNKD